MQGRIFGGEVRRSVVFCFFRFSAGAVRHIKNLYPLFIIIKVNKLTVECTQRGLRLFCVNLMRNANGGLAALWRFAVVCTDLRPPPAEAHRESLRQPLVGTSLGVISAASVVFPPSSLRVSSSHPFQHILCVLGGRMGSR